MGESRYVERHGAVVMNVCGAHASEHAYIAINKMVFRNEPSNEMRKRLATVGEDI